MKLGDKVRDRVSGYVGVVVGRTEYFSGNVQCLVASTELSSNGLPQDTWIDESRLEEVEKNKIPFGFIPKATYPNLNNRELSHLRNNEQYEGSNFYGTEVA